MLRGCFLKHVAEEVHLWLQMSKIVDDVVLPADSSADIDQIVSWLDAHGYVERGALIGQDPAVFWLRPDDEPEYLGEIVGQPVAPATVRYVRGEKRFASTRTTHEIWRSRRRNPNDLRDLAYIRLPTRAERARVHELEPVRRRQSSSNADVRIDAQASGGGFAPQNTRKEATR